MLLVDDDTFMVRTLSDVLKLKGWNVATAHSGEEAVNLVAADSFDVVLMDVKMPGMDGVDALKAMRAVRPNIRVILMTAYAAEDRLAEAERVGVVRVMAKPVNLETLAKLLAEGLVDRPVLVVDHDSTFLRTLSQVLVLRGFEVAVANSLDHAKELMDERRPLAVLLHMHLGDMTAREAVTAVHQACPASALILYSGEPDAADEARHGLPPDWVHAYLQKPFAVEQVTGVLDAIRQNG